MSEIQDRKVTTGTWCMPRRKGEGRRTHFFNNGMETPVCGSLVRIKVGRQRPGKFDPESRSITDETNADAGTRVACGLCVSIVVEGVDLRADHARHVAAWSAAEAVK